MLSLIVGIILLVSFSNSVAGETACELLDRCSSKFCAVMGGTAVLNTGATNITGDVCVSPGTNVTGFPPGDILDGSIATTTASSDAQVALTCVYETLHNFTTCDTNITGQNLGSKNLTPGVYCFDTTAKLNGTLTLNGNGDSTTPFIFQIGTALTTVAGSKVVLANGTLPCQVFWVVGTTATLAAGSNFTGVLIAQTSITVGAGAVVDGRLLSRASSVSLNADTVHTCECPVVTSGLAVDNDGLDAVGIIWISVLGAICILVTIVLLAYGCFINGYAFVPFAKGNEYSTSADINSSWTGRGRRQRMYENERN